MNQFIALMGVGFFIVTSMGLSSCGKLEDMHNMTKELRDDTEEVKNNVVKTNETIALTDETVDQTLRGLRQGDALAARMRLLESMEKQTEMTPKMKYAAAYMKAFEFQVWSRRGKKDTDSYRWELAAEALQEFFWSLKRYTVEDNVTINPLNPLNFQIEKSVLGRIETGDGIFSKPSELRISNMKNINALAAAVGKENLLQDDVTRDHPEIPEMSLLTLIKDALSQKEAVLMTLEGASVKESIERGDRAVDQIPTWIVRVLEEEKDAIYILNVRHNFLMAMALGKVVGSNDGGTILTKPWTAATDELNPAQIDQYNSWLDEAVKTRQFLSGQKYAVQTYAPLQKIYSNMKISIPPSSKDKAKGTLLRKFEQYVKVLTGRP